jgi:hypothetical protein
VIRNLCTSVRLAPLPRRYTNRSLRKPLRAVSDKFALAAELLRVDSLRIDSLGDRSRPNGAPCQHRASCIVAKFEMDRHPLGQCDMQTSERFVD